MLRNVRHTKNKEETRGHQLQRRVSAYVLKHGSPSTTNSYSLKNRIRELEEEVEKLRSTVKFFQETFLLDD